MEFATSGLSMDAILKRFSNPICEQKRSSICFKGEEYIYILEYTIKIHRYNLQRNAIRDQM